MHRKFEYPGAEVLVERDRQGADGNDLGGWHRVEQRAGAGQCGRQRGHRVGSEHPSGVDTPLSHRGMVGVAVEHLEVVFLGAVDGGRRSGDGLSGRQVGFHGGDGAPGVANEVAHRPAAECGLRPLFGPDDADEVDERGRRAPEGVCLGHEPIVPPRAVPQDRGMTAIRPTPSALIGRYVRLDPLQRTDLPALFVAIGHPQVFSGGYGGGPAGYRDTAVAFAEWAVTYFDWDGGNVYAVRVVGGPHAGTLVGTSTLGHFEPELQHAHIGWTAFDPRVWGTQVNAEAKLLMLALAFDSGFGRVKIQADMANERSRAAIAGIGATFEGVVRRDRPRADGSWRDSAVFAIIVDEWPGVRGLLEHRLAQFGGHPVEFREPRKARDALGETRYIRGMDVTDEPRGADGKATGNPLIDELTDIRQSIDNIDAALVHLLAERFKFTQQVGRLKAAGGLPASDPERERVQISRLRALAEESRLDPAFAEKFLNFIVAEVIQHHELIANTGAIVTTQPAETDY